MKKNDVFTVTIEDMGEDGAGIGKTDGYTWFIKDALIGDVIQASVMKMKKNYGFARLVKILEPAPGRVEPRCPVARACGGGCQLQELDYGEQLRFKEKGLQSFKEDRRHGPPGVPAGGQGKRPRAFWMPWSWSPSSAWRTPGVTATRPSIRWAWERTDS